MKSEKNIQKAKNFVVWSLMISLFFHAAFFIFTSFEKMEKSAFLPSPKEKEKKIRVVLRTKKSKPRQIVTSQDSKKKKRDPKAKFLSKKTQSFDRQTSAKRIGAFQAAGKGVKNGKKKTKSEKVQKTQKASQQVAVRSKASKKGRKSKNKISMADLSVGTQQIKKAKKKKRAQPSLAALGLKNGQKGKTGLSANNDFIEDIPLSDMTRLNTVEYKYYGFYHRIKQKLEQYWGNSIQRKAQALWKSGRRIPASENRITSLEILIDGLGNIVKIHVKGSSGVRELDDAAIESFNKAGPFPNPPKGMIKNGLAKIEWGFVVKS
jgi:TonB family protein